MNPASLVLMPTPAAWGAAPAATWVTAAGWARALERALGPARLVTPAGVLTPAEAEAFVARRTARGHSGSVGRRAWGAVRGVVREEVHTARKDVRDLIRAVKYAPNAFRSVKGLRLVWQHHELFQGAGHVLARRAGAPLIQFVDAPVVWEATRWGVRRPWGRALERVGETPQFAAADLIACVSDEIRHAAVTLGAAANRTIVTPCSVDAEKFGDRAIGRASVRRSLGISDHEIVVGWLGSFRRFHGLDVLIDAASKDGLRERITLLLVGDGRERGEMEARARARGISRIFFTGLVPHSEVPDHLSSFDVAVVTAPAVGGFHYSPLKLKEYMAAGRPIIAPRVGEIPGFIEHGVEALLTPAGDSSSVAEALRLLLDDPEKARSLGNAARRKVLAIGTWDEQVRISLQALRGLGWNI